MTPPLIVIGIIVWLVWAVKNADEVPDDYEDF